MITVKTREEIVILREGGGRLARIIEELKQAVRPGVSALELNILAESLAKKGGDEPAFLNYQPAGARRPFPASLCVSVNDEVVHGIPNESEKILKEGDIVSLDMGLKHNGLFTDMAVTVPVGKADEMATKLLKVTEEAMKRGIKEAVAGNRVGNISYGICGFVKSEAPEFAVVEQLAGHGVGYAVHEDPFVPNYGTKKSGPILKDGMVLAIEPMVNEGDKRVVLGEDGFTYRTADGKRSAHFEVTVVVCKEGVQILTQ